MVVIILASCFVPGKCGNPVCHVTSNKQLIVARQTVTSSPLPAMSGVFYACIWFFCIRILLFNMCICVCVHVCLCVCVFLCVCLYFMCCASTAMHALCNRMSHSLSRFAILLTAVLILFLLTVYGSQTRWRTVFLAALPTIDISRYARPTSSWDDESSLFKASDSLSESLWNDNAPVEQKSGVSWKRAQRQRHDQRGANKVRVLFVDKHTEQLGRASRNLMRLLVIAQAMQRSIPMPYVHDSRFYGAPFSKSRRLNFSAYFDANGVNARLVEGGHRAMLSMEEVLGACPNGWHVALLLLYLDPNMNKIAPDKKRQETIDACADQARRDPRGWVECPELIPLARFVKSQRRPKNRFRLPARRGIVVDTARLHDVRMIEALLDGEQCVYLFKWAGEGPQRITLTGLSAEEEQGQVPPYEMPFAKNLVAQSLGFQREHLSPPFLALHVRSESLLKFQGLQHLNHCIRQAANNIRGWMDADDSRKQLNIFIMTDMRVNGSDTLAHHVNESDVAMVSDLLATTIPGQHVYFNDNSFADKGKLSIVELSTAADAHMLVGIGGGNFQEWIVKLRRYIHPSYAGARRFCTGKALDGW